MIIKKNTTILLITLSSNIAIAAENNSTDASFSGWPLLLLILIFIIFRKQIFTADTIDYLKDNSLNITEQEEVPQPQTTPSEKSLPSEKITLPKTKESTIKKKTRANSANKDISDASQCQASTAKGTRCKRTTTLEKTSITIDDNTYRLTVCNQHNNKKLKPFPDLIK